MTTLEKRQNAYRWWVPNATFLGKLGDPNGPSTEECLFARRVRDDFRQSGFWTEAALAPTAPELPKPISPRGKDDEHGRAEAAAGRSAADPADQRLRLDRDDDPPF